MNAGAQWFYLIWAPYFCPYSGRIFCDPYVEPCNKYSESPIEVWAHANSDSEHILNQDKAS